MKKHLRILFLLLISALFLIGASAATCKHDWQETGSISATCQQKSSVSYICALCGESKVVEGKLGDHLYGKETSVSPTCTEEGKKTQVCLYCGKEKVETQKALGHDWKESKKSTATCTEAGTAGYVCTRCGEEKTENIAALGHDYSIRISSSATCTAKGQATYQCSRCKDLTLKSESALGHDFELSDGPTCTESGKYTRTCKVCGYVKVDTSNTKALGHDTENATWSTYKKATCTEEGSRRAKCARCKQYVYQAIPKSEHSYGKLQVTKLPTSSAAGRAEQVCENCGTAKTVTVAKGTTTYSSDYAVPTVVCSKKGGTITRGTTVSLSCALPEATIYYTLNGKSPATSTARKTYTGPITLTDGVTLKAVAEYGKIPSSEILTCTFKVDANESWVYFTPEASDGGYMPLKNGADFRPDEYATRYEVIVALDNLLDSYAEDADSVFADVDRAHRDVVAKFVGAKLLSGYEDGTFRGEANIKRSELAKVLTVALGLNPKWAVASFKDVPTTHWAYGYIAALTEEGYLKGDTDGNFRPEANITRAELCAVLNRIAGVSTDEDGDVTGVPEGHWAHADIHAAVYKKK